MLRPASWTRPAGASPAWVIAGEPSSRPRFAIERSRAERGVESLFGGSKHAGRSATRRESCSLVRLTMREPSRSCHGEGNIQRLRFRTSPRWVSPGYGERHVCMVWFGTGEARLRSLVSKDRSYKPVVKSSGAQRESDGVVVPPIAGRNPVGGKGPDFGRADRGGRCKGMAGTARPNHPAGSWPGVNVPHRQSWLWASAKSPPWRRSRALDPRRGDCRRVAWVRRVAEVA